MKQFLRHIFLLVAMLVATTPAWAATLYGKTAVGAGKGTATVEIYSRWTPNQVKDSKSSSNASIVTVSRSVSGVDWGFCKFKATPSSGYSFDAWYTDQACSSGKQTSNPYQTSDEDGNKTYTFYAKFVPNNYMVSFNANGGTVGTGSKSVTYDAAYGTLPTPTRDGFTFTGWYTTASGGNQVTESTIMTTAGNHTLYAHWTESPYTIAFNGNGNTSGTMSNMAMVYNTAKNLNANAFARQYTVTYNANGGTSTVPSAAANYTFVGWEDPNSIVYNGITYSYDVFDAPYYANTYSDLYDAFGYNKYNLLNHYIGWGKGENRSPKGTVPGVYPNNASVSNLTTTANATVTLYAQWKSASVILPNATKAGAVIEGWYAGDVKVGEPGDSYTPTANVILTAKWIEKYTPEITGNDYALFVGEEQSNAFSLKYTDNPTAHIQVVSISEVNDGTGKVISYDAKNNKIIAHNAGEATIYLSQPETGTIQAGTSATYKVVVSKINNTLAIASSSYTKYVDDEITNIISSVNSDATVTTSSSDATIAYYDVTNDKIIIPNSEAKSFSSQAIAITIAQAETYKYTAVEKTIALTVNKYTPKFTWNAGNATYYYKSSIANIFDTSNDDFGYTIVSDNEHVAKVIDNTLHIYNVEETAKITVTQAENYKWNSETETYTITPANPNNHVEFTITNNNHTIFEESFTSKAEWNGSAYRFGDGGWTPRTDEVVIAFTGIPDTLYFDKTLERSWDQLPGTYLCRVYESVDGNEWKQVWEHDERVENKNGNKVALSPTTKCIKFYYYGTVFANYKNIRVTERREFTAIPDAVDFGVKGQNHGEQDTLITFNHINAGRITKVELRGDDASYFSITPTTIPNTGRDQYGTTYLNITFDNKKENRGQSPYNAELRIYDNNGQEEIVPLTGKRYGKSYPQFKWNPNGLPYYTNSSIVNIATSSNTDYTNCPLTYTTSDPTIAKVENGVLYIYDKEQEVTITVSQNENNDFYAGSSKLTFTPRERPELVVPFHVTKDIYEKSVNPVYRCSWNETESAIQLGQNSQIYEEPAWDWNAKTALITFDGVPCKLSFKHRAINGSSTNAIWLVEQSADGNEWGEVYRETSSSTNYTNVNDIELDENTRYLRFSFSGNFGGYIKDINVSELVGYKYLRAADGHYLSRGAKWGTQAVVDAFGVVSRISRYTQDNENIYTRFFFVDNEQYMFETETEDEQRLHEVFTDHGTALNTNHLWQINNNGGILTIQSANDVGVSHRGNYITAINGVLAFTTNEAEATKWQMEDYTEHPQYITDMLNRQAAAAAIKDFGQDVNTLEKVRSRLKEEEFEIHEITIPALKLGEQTGEGRTVDGMPHIYEQTITGLDTGFYRLTIKALYRISNSEIAWKCHQEKGKESVLAYAYANNVQYPIQSVYASYQSPAFENTDEVHNGKYYSTTLSSAAIAFNDENRYLNDVYVYVTPDPGKTTGTLRYGIKCPSYVPGAWLAYSTITLTHFGRKEYIFEGQDHQKPTDWNTPENWNRGSVPNQYHNVRISANTTIPTHVNVYSMTIDENKVVNITSDGGVTVGYGGVKNAASNGSSIVVENNTTGVGYLRIHPSAVSLPERVTVQYTTRAKAGGAKDQVWQYVGAPGNEMEMSNDGVMVYYWSEQDGWVYANTNMTPFDGYALTRTAEGSATYTITAQPIYANHTLDLTYTAGAMEGGNLFVNSYLAPIDMTKFTNDNNDFEGNIEKTFYLFNSGSWDDWQGEGGSTNSMVNGSSAGQYYAIAPFSAGFIDNDEQKVIPPMQGVYVVVGEGGGKIKLQYNKHVYQADTKDMNSPMRVPKEEDPNFMRVRLQVNSLNSGADRMYVIQHKDATLGYDNGYDAKNILADGQANIYTNELEGQMEISVADQIDSTFIGFTAGEDSVYTLTFTSLVGEDMYLHDLLEDSLFLLVEDGQYTFSAQANSVNDMRFQLILHPELPGQDEPEDNMTTGMDNVMSSARVWVNDKRIYIAAAPQNSTIAVYTVSGMCITSPLTIHEAPCTVDLSHLPTGVYVLRLNNQAYKFVCK